MDKDLEQKIAERKKQTEERKITQKSCIVARTFGSGEPVYGADDGDGKDLIGRDYHFENAEIHIRADYDGYTQIFYEKQKSQRKLVFQHSHKHTVSYIPGPWEETLENLYKEVLKKEEQIKKQQQNEAHKKELEERARWGL